LALDNDGNTILPMVLKSGNFGATDFFSKAITTEASA